MQKVFKKLSIPIITKDELYVLQLLNNKYLKSLSKNFNYF